MRMTTANKITIARILLVPVFVVELLNYTGNGREWHRLIALAIFLVAAIGDGVDGYVARHYNQRTDMGALLDPLADKLLLVLGLVILSLDNRPWLISIPLWLTGTVLARDVMLLLLMVLVNYLVGHGTVRPRWTGKIATVLQMACVVWVLLRWTPGWIAGLAAMATLFTGVSGLIYLRDGILMIKRRALTEPAVSPSAPFPPRES
ncbi:MAG: CDP-alcohol phosphatidyltransferase family protein [Verrucomicrobiales bacterium]|nr:CDP-alcohol phosphatidyltransferase family protein [Verrucomicrobiales bacterium]